MRINWKHILVIVIILLFFIAGYRLSNYFSDKKTQELKTELRKNIIKNDSLVKISPTRYKKLVADTLTNKQLSKKVDSLEVEVQNAKALAEIEFKPKPIKNKKVDTVFVKNDTTNLVDYYPKKENYFIKYSAKITEKENFSKWDFNKQSINLALGINSDGNYEVRSKVPKWLDIKKLDVESKPIKKETKNKFGFILGGGYTKDFHRGTEGVILQTGLRYKKTYLLFNGTTNEEIGLSLLFEF